MSIKKFKQFGDKFQEDLKHLDALCELKPDNWRPTPVRSDLIKWKEWQKKGEQRVRQEFKLAGNAWRRMSKHDVVRVEYPPDEIVVHGEDDDELREDRQDAAEVVEKSYQRPYVGSNIMIKDVTDILGSRRGIEGISESLMDLLDEYLPEPEEEEEAVCDEEMMVVNIGVGADEEVAAEDYLEEMAVAEEEYELAVEESQKVAAHQDDQIVPKVELASDGPYPETKKSMARYKAKYGDLVKYEKEETIEAIKRRILELSQLKVSEREFGEL